MVTKHFFILTVALLPLSPLALEAKDKINTGSIPNMRTAFENLIGWIPSLKTSPEDYYEEYEILDANSLLNPQDTLSLRKSAKKANQNPKP